MRTGGARGWLSPVKSRPRRHLRGNWKPFGGLGRAAGHLRGDAVSRHELLSVREHSVAWLVPLGMLVGIAVADITTDLFQIVAWTVLVPGVAAAICGVRITALFAVLATVVYLLADLVWKHRAETGPPGLTLVIIGGAVAVVVAGIRTDSERRMMHMRDVAETTRRTVLRPLPEIFGGLEHAAVYLTADSEARVGGDFYDIQPGPHGTRILIGDVQGKGLGAVDTAAALLGTFRECAYHERDLAVVVRHLEIRMRRHRALAAALGRPGGDRFATAVLVGFRDELLDAVEVAVLGHEPPLAVGPRGVRPLTVAGGLPLGMADLVPDSGVPVVRAALAADEALLLVTDGVTEARNADGSFYRHSEAVAAAVAADPANIAPGRLAALVREGTLRHSRRRLADDTTVFAVRRVGHAPVWP
ncbi:PP2C family protein-serine/threonine phosphatase [Streptomyces olivaceus]|uniref:PP2C family protein-serine/threonine phosphatase n=1 Tax=Streptomyces olivaceus TaxID=47716 RepID=UPI0036EEE798